MHELSGFEQRLALALEDYAGPRRPVDGAVIARHAVESGPVRPVRPAIAWPSRWTESSRMLRLALVAVLAAALVGGGLLVGSMLQRATVPPSLPPTGLVTSEPSPTADVMASTFSCAEAQAAAARSTTTWSAGPAPASPSTAETGWIAVWGSDEVPELFLIDPASGATCSLARFEAYTNTPTVATRDGQRDWIPPRGPLVWSPDGNALAFVVFGNDGLVRDLYVWSDAGLTGPLLSLHDEFFLPGRPSWSPDGSLLAVPDLTNTHVPRATNVWILSQSGAPARTIASGCVCHLSPVTWSPSGRRIIATTRDLIRAEDAVASSVDEARMHPVTMSELEMAAPFDLAPYGFVDDDTILLVDPASGRFVGRRTDGQADRDLGLIGIRVETIMNERANLAPDRTAWLLGDGGRITIIEVPSGRGRVLVPNLPETIVAGWAPNSRAVGYLTDVQRADQGVWIVNRAGTAGSQVAAGPFVLGLDPTSPFPWQPVWPRR